MPGKVTLRETQETIIRTIELKLLSEQLSDICLVELSLNRWSIMKEIHQ